VSGSVIDRLGRPLGSLRLSVTDRCNMRCGYCMPNEEYAWLPRASILSYEEAARLVRVFAGLGAGKVRLTGGEPLLRRDLDRLVRMIREVPGVREVALTTNGILLAGAAAGLRAAGLERVTVSLDTLRPERLLGYARSPRHSDIVAGIDGARAAGFQSVKLNAVVIRGYNDDEVVPLLEFARDRGLEIRFIEYMDVGGASGWRPDAVVSRAEILAAIAARHGPIEPLDGVLEPRGAAPAERFRLGDGTRFGIIASTTAPFCGACDRSRITADGTWFLCLYADQGIDLRTPLRDGWSDAEIAALVERTWRNRLDRGAERRLEAPDRGALYPLEGLRADPRREMHTRGG
jgi:cyclic pyranopterin phosphate synthase